MEVQSRCSLRYKWGKVTNKPDTSSPNSSLTSLPISLLELARA